MCAVVLAAGCVLLAPGTASARGGRTALSPNAHGTYHFGRVAVGASATQQFSFSTTPWVQWSGTLSVHLAASSAFSVSSDGCTGVSLGPAVPSCQVSVTFAPTARGQAFGTLTVAGVRAHHRGFGRHRLFATVIVLTGSGGRASGGTTGGSPVGGSGPAALQLTPGTASAGNGVSFSFGEVNTSSQKFKLTNTGGEAALPLALDGWTEGGYSLSDDTCTGTALAAGASCTFTETWTSDNDPMCDGAGQPVSLSTTVDSADASTTYADVSLSAICG